VSWPWRDPPSSLPEPARPDRPWSKCRGVSSRTFPSVRLEVGVLSLWSLRRPRQNRSVAYSNKPFATSSAITALRSRLASLGDAMVENGRKEAVDSKKWRLWLRAEAAVRLRWLYSFGDEREW
jgi:hypothetical protein